MHPIPQPILQVEQLKKHFNGITAVNGISFDVQEGTCIGLLGPNGAGKTTTVEMMEGIKSPDSGKILYRGEALGKPFKNNAGIMFQSTALQDFITVQEALELFQCFYPHTTDIQQIAEDCALTDFLHQDASKLSGGQRQRLLLGIALLNDPDILFLDEPTTGLDPQARHNFWQLIHKIKQQNKTIVLTTHYMDEAYELCDRIIIMDRGEIIAEGTPKALLAEHFNDIVIQVPTSAALESLLGSTDDNAGLSINRRLQGVEICTSDINLTIRQLMAANVSLSGMQVRERTLEDLFLELTGKALRQ